MINLSDNWFQALSIYFPCDLIMTLRCYKKEKDPNEDYYPGTRICVPPPGCNYHFMERSEFPLNDASPEIFSKYYHLMCHMWGGRGGNWLSGRDKKEDINLEYFEVFLFDFFVNWKKSIENNDKDWKDHFGFNYKELPVNFDELVRKRTKINF
jgi:hypothetical protein